MRIDDTALPQAALGATYGNPCLLTLASNEWHTPWWMARQHLLTRLAARGWPVVYSTGPQHLWHRDEARWTRAGWRQGFDRVVSGQGSVLVDRPGRLLARWPSVGVWDRFVLRRHARGLAGAHRDLGAGAGVLFLTHPKFWSYVENLRHRRVVLYVHDAYDIGPGWNLLWAQDLERLVERADLIIAVAENMARRLPGDGPQRAKLLPHGVDCEGIMVGADAPCPADLARIPRPRLGYVGRVNLKTDLRMVAEIARRRPHWQWVFVGAVNEEALSAGPGTGADLAAVKRYPNVHFLGVKDRGDVPAYLAHMDVNTVIYRFDEGGYWAAGYPTKVFEYLAAGKPVVSSALENVRSRAAVLDVVRTAEEWIAAIERALDSDGVGTVEQRRALAMENTWDSRVDLLEGWLFDLLRG